MTHPENPEHTKILKSDTDVWNRWRRSNSEIIPDLNGANLSGLNLWRCDLQRARLYKSNLKNVDLSVANLKWASMSRANLTEANLFDADLSNAVLRRAKLIEADLRQAFLAGAILSRANLTNANLFSANLRGASLRNAILNKANFTSSTLCDTDFRNAKIIDTLFTKADLSRADFRGVNLCGIDFSEVNLRKANLAGANLAGANLTKTNLIEANLNKTNLEYVNFREAIFHNTRLDYTDMSKSIGMNSIRHNGPSVIGVYTIQKSKGKIPDVFLRGCGFNDIDILYSKLANPNLTTDQVTDIIYKIHELHLGDGVIQHFSLFISYSTADEKFAQKLYEDLQDYGIRCWFAPHDIKSGEKIFEQIDNAIQIFDRLLLILSGASMTSEWVKTEISKARKKEVKQDRQVLFPISIVDFEQIKRWECFDADVGKDSAKEIREYYIPDFSNWQDDREYKQAFTKLARDLKKSGII